MTGAPWVDPAPDFSPWTFWERADAARRDDQLAYLDELRARGHRVGTGTFVSRLAAVDAEDLQLGERSYVAAHCYVSGTVSFGADCSLNPFAVVRGDVRIGDATRIGAHASVLGFNHGTADLATPIFRQPLTSKGVRVGSDTWIGSHAVVLDGVTVGSHAVVAAGAVVTRDVPDHAVVAGNPARVLRDRRSDHRTHRRAAASPSLGARLAAFADRARDEVEALLASCWQDDRYRDAPGARATVRAHADAVELSDLLLRRPPPQLAADGHVARLRGWQQPGTGLVPELDADGRPAAGDAVWARDEAARYHVLAVGHALDLLGSSFAHPVREVEDLDAAAVVGLVSALDVDRHAWGAGAQVDELATALLHAVRAGRRPAAGTLQALLGHLVLSADPVSGVWGRPGPDGDLLQAVNGFYRTARGTFARLGLPVPRPVAVVDTVLRHAGDVQHLGPGRENACNVLDVAQPLWLARTQVPEHRRVEVVAVAAEHLDRLLGRWEPGRGIAFAAAGALGSTPAQRSPGLKGTEMWLATAWYLADLLDEAPALGYRPRGVHRPEPEPGLLGLLGSS